MTADGVLLKDGVVPKTAYPDALLLDGSRQMTGDLDFANDLDVILRKATGDGSARLKCVGIDSLGVYKGDDSGYGNIVVMQFNADIGMYSSWIEVPQIQPYGESTDVIIRTGTHAVPPVRSVIFRSQQQFGDMVEVARMTNGEFGIPKAGNIVGLAGKSIDFPAYKVSGVAGVDGSFTTVDGKTVTVSKGIITSIV